MRHTPFPQQCVIELTAACDQKCVFCGRTYMDRPKKMMKPEMFHAIVREIGRENPECEVWPTFMGEALLLGRKLFPLLRDAREAGCRKLTLNSNGSRLTPENIDGLLTSGLDRFIISCDGHSKATYESIRRGGNFERLHAGANLLIDTMRSRGLELPLIEMQFSVFDENEHELDDFRRYWLDRGVVVKSRPKVYWSGLVDGGSHRVTTGSHRSPCLWALDTAAIHWNGNVVMCAIDCDGKYVAGNVGEQSLAEIWNGPLRWIRELHLQHRFRELPEVCRRCTDWKVKQAHAFFPTDRMRESYESYIRRGRHFFSNNNLPPSDDARFTTDGDVRAGPAAANAA